MATKVIPISPVKSWSFSRFMDYEQCPLKFKLKHLEKVTEPPNDAMARGAAMHDNAAAYITGKAKTLDAAFKLHYAEDFKELRAIYKRSKATPMIVEDSWAFTRDWTETTWNDWVNCWLRVKLDCAHFTDDSTLRIRDWKSGKYRGEDSDKNQEYLMQLELYALSALLLKPFLERVIPSLEYVDVGIQYPLKPIVYTRADIPRLKKLWEKRVAPMFHDTLFAPRPNSLCKWCHYRASNAAKGGGQCKY